MLTLPFLPEGPRASGPGSTTTPVREEGYPARRAGDSVPPGSLFRLDGDHRGRAVHCRQGALWVTQAEDAQDHVLQASDLFVITRPGRVVIQVLEEAAFSIV